MQKKYQKICASFICALSLILGFESCQQAPEQDSSATITAYPPQPLADRPIDLAYFNVDEADTQVSFETNRESTGDFNALWTAANTTTEALVHWSAKTPVTLTINLAERSHVNEIIVYPFTRQLGVGAFDAEIIAPDGTAYPVAKFLAERTKNERLDVPADALSFEFPPRIAEQLRLRFTRGTPEHPKRVYLRAVRILGTAPHAPEMERTEDVLPPLNAEERINLASLTLDQIEQRVHVSEDKRPNGRYEFPWLNNNNALPLSDQDNAYWCATSPSWVTIELGDSCIVDEVRLTPFDSIHGFNLIYLKIIGDDGREYDTNPPATHTFTSSEEAPLEARLRFAPVKAKGIKIYLRGAEQSNALTYVRRINIFGIQAPSVQTEIADPDE